MRELIRKKCTAGLPETTYKADDSTNKQLWGHQFFYKSNYQVVVLDFTHRRDNTDRGFLSDKAVVIFLHREGYSLRFFIDEWEK